MMTEEVEPGSVDDLLNQFISGVLTLKSFYQDDLTIIEDTPELRNKLRQAIQFVDKACEVIQ